MAQLLQAHSCGAAGSSCKGRFRPGSKARNASCRVAGSSRLVQQVRFMDSSPQEYGRDLGFKTGLHDAYTLHGLIGSGGFGKVHLGVHKESGLQVAVKCMSKIRGKQMKAATLEKISLETSMLQRAQVHPGVVKLMDCFEDDDNAFLVTELLAGGDLQQYSETHGPLDEASLALVASEVLKFIQACHALDILYIDVKPGNFCLQSSAGFSSSASADCAKVNLKAIDFGCSQNIGSRRLSKRAGTLAYMSPEMMGADFGHKADVWGTGVMLYWLFSQHLPFWESGWPPKITKLEDMTDAVSKAPIRYDYGPWLHMSAEGLDFMRACLTRPETDRIGVEEALRHPWLAKLVNADGCSLASNVAVMAGSAANVHDSFTV